MRLSLSLENCLQGGPEGAWVSDWLVLAGFSRSGLVLGADSGFERCEKRAATARETCIQSRCSRGSGFDKLRGLGCSGSLERPGYQPVWVFLP